MTNKVRSEYKVRQLISADGRFVALFCHDGEYSTEEIVCYGLCECMDTTDTSSLKIEGDPYDAVLAMVPSEYEIEVANSFDDFQAIVTREAGETMRCEGGKYECV